MSMLERLKAAKSLSDMAVLLECKPSALSNLLYVRKPQYTNFEIKKKVAESELSAPPNLD